MNPARSIQTALALVLATLAAAELAAAAAKAPGAARAAASPTAQKASAARLALPFIDDDYTKALAQARASRKPIFIEAWAPW